MNRIKKGTSENEVINILEEILIKKHSFSSTQLLDHLEKVKSPLLSHNKTGRVLNKNIITRLKQYFPMMEYDKNEKRWFLT
jgi:hypothetical protein